MHRQAGDHDVLSEIQAGAELDHAKRGHGRGEHDDPAKEGAQPVSPVDPVRRERQHANPSR